MRGGGIVLIIVARAELLRLISLMAASNSRWVTSSSLLILRLFAQFVVHIVLPDCVSVGLGDGGRSRVLRSRLSLGLGAWVRCLGRYLGLLVLVGLRISVGLRCIILIMGLRVVILMLIEVMVSSVIAAVVITVPATVSFVTIISISVVVPP